ncbi:hypothetical protein P8X24_08160 [Pyrococcus kukulkanii]|uniref:hypothetical protein n=1 Tax=Pyrococcus kukulkanii TaxID=1609559 RepID=UPI0035630A05
MRIFIRNYFLPWLLIIVFWLALWLLSSQLRESLNVVNVFVAFLLLVPFLLVALHFVGKALERYGYSREDIKRLPEIIKKTHGRLYISKEVFDIVGKALIFWGLMATAVVMTRDPLKGLLNGAAIFARIFALFIILVSMVIWVMAFPHGLYKLLTGNKLNRDFLVELMRQNIFYTGSSPREFLWAHVGVHSPRFCGCPDLDRPTHCSLKPVHYGGTGRPNTRRVQPALHLA